MILFRTICVVLKCLLLLVFCSVAVADIESRQVKRVQPICLATDKYPEETKSTNITSRAKVDLSCLIDLAAAKGQRKPFQLIDIRPKAKAENSPIFDALPISINALPYKSFLKNRSILLLADGFSRVKLGYACARLKKAGFTNVKALVDGARVWSVNNPSKKQVDQSFRKKGVSPRDFSYEYKNGKVITVALGEKTATKLGSIGILSHNLYALKEKEITNKIIELVKTSGGYYPIVLVDRSAAVLNSRLQSIPNLYYLSEGIDSLIAYTQEKKWINYNRTTGPHRKQCPNV